MGKRLGAGVIGLIVAVGVAVGATFYLRKTHNEIKRVVEPVTLRVPDLFPAETLLYAEMQGLQEGWKTLDQMYARVDETAAGLALRRSWDKDRESLPKEVRTPLESFEAQLTKVEQRFGFRPNSRDFFEAYGKHTAFGLVPSTAGAKPHLLAVVLLPEESLAGLLQSKMGNASGVRPAAEALHRGFPVFVDDWEGTAIFYGIGRGHLFISDDAAPVTAALDRLADATDGEHPARPKSSLGDDAILSRVSPAGQPAPQAVFYAKGSQNFAVYDENLALVDEFVKTTLARSPGDTAIAISFSGGNSGTARTSLAPAKSPAAWKKGIPAGIYDLSAVLDAPGAPARKNPAWESFRKKALWSEINDLANDPARIRMILKDALRDPSKFDDELLMRLPKDVKLVSDMIDSSMADAGSPDGLTTVVALKHYAGKDGSRIPQWILMVDFPPIPSLALGGGLDMLKSHFPEWVDQKAVTGGVRWSLATKQIDKLAESAKTPDMPLESSIEKLRATVLLYGDRMYIVSGEEAEADVQALAEGKGTSLESDPLFNEALAALPPGCVTVSFTRPKEQFGAAWELARSLIQTAADKARDGDKESADLSVSLIAMVDAAAGWQGKVRASVSGLDPATGELVQVLLRDEAVAKTAPEMLMEPGKFGVADYLPGDTWLHHSWRLKPGTESKALRDAFIGALPGGEGRFNDIIRSHGELQAWYDAVLTELIENVEGEAGINLSMREVIPDLKAKNVGMETETAVLAPTAVAFAEVREPKKAMHAIRFLFEKFDKAMNHGRTIDERFGSYQRYGGSQPWGCKFVAGALSGKPALALDIYIPHSDGRHYHIHSVVAVSRGPYIFVTNSLAAAQLAAGTKPGDPGTLAARLKDEMGGNGLEPLASERHLYHSATFAQQVLRLAEPAMRTLPQISLAGYRERPPQERIEAHERGWARFGELLMDLFVEPGWESSGWVREGSKVTWKERRIPEAKK